MHNILNILSDGNSFCWDFVLTGFRFRSHMPKSMMMMMMMIMMGLTKNS